MRGVELIEIVRDLQEGGVVSETGDPGRDWVLHLCAERLSCECPTRDGHVGREEEDVARRP